MARKRARKAAFVPGVIFTTVFAGVVPACVLSCSGDDPGSSTAADSGIFGVADDAFSVAAEAFGVADIGFDTGKKDTGSTDAADGGVADAGDAKAGDAEAGDADGGDGKGDAGEAG